MISAAGLPRVEVLSLRLNPASRTLRAWTHGRSVWDFQLGTFIPAFSLSSISPTSASPGAGITNLTVIGNGFTSGSQVNWNGSTSNVTTTFVSATQLTATLAASLLSTAGNAQVTVTDPGQTSPTNALTFTVIAPVPCINSLSSPPAGCSSSNGLTPNSATAGTSGADVQVTITGANFASNAQVNWDGSPTGVTLNSMTSTQINATLSRAQLLIYGGVGRITVVNPPPGGGASNIADFTVNQTIPPANDNFANATTALPQKLFM